MFSISFAQQHLLHLRPDVFNRLTQKWYNTNGATIAYILKIHRILACLSMNWSFGDNLWFGYYFNLLYVTNIIFFQLFICVIVRFQIRTREFICALFFVLTPRSRNDFNLCEMSAKLALLYFIIYPYVRPLHRHLTVPPIAAPHTMSSERTQ